MTSNASQTEAYPCLQHHEEELPTLIKSDEAPSLVAIPSWPPAPRLVPAVHDKRRVTEAFPLRPPTSPRAEATFGQAPHELSPFGRSSLDRSSLDRSSLDRSSLDRSSLDRSSFDRSSFDRSSFDRSSFDRSSFDRSSFDRSSFDRSSFDRSAQQRVASSPLTLVAAYAALGASAFWAAWSLARFM